MVEKVLDLSTKMVNYPFMKLKDYLSASGQTHAEFAKEIKVSTQALYRYLEGERIPAREIMSRINAKTNGQVTANSFYQ